MNEVLSVGLLKTDGTQNRLEINDDTVEDYASVISENKTWVFPRLDVFHDGESYFVADGFHRLLAARRAKRGSVPCKVHKGTVRDARIFGMTANDKQGLRLSRADKRACVEWLLENGGKMTRVEIASKAGVSRKLVQNIVSKQKLAELARKNKNVQNAHSDGEVSEDTPDPRDDLETTGDLEDFDEDPKPRSTKPPKRLDRKAYYKQWDNVIGPLVRLVDKIAEGVGEKHDPHHVAIQDALNTATEEMVSWMRVEA